MRSGIRSTSITAAVACVFVAWLAPAAVSREPGLRGPAYVQASQADRFVVSDAMIPMRDGVRLHTKIFVPKDQRDALPIVMKTSTTRTTTSSGNARR